MSCPGFSVDKIREMSNEDYLRVTCEGSAQQYHLAAALPHLFCGCGTEANICHPGRCCRYDDYGDCVNCGKPAPMALAAPADEAEFTDPLFAVATEGDA